METDYQALLDRLKAANCPHKLYPARLRALEVVTGERLLAEVQKTIIMRIGVAARNIGWKWQFQRDLDTYGLLEAIVYFHSYPPLPGDFVEDACRLYEYLAALYLEHHEEIVRSSDPRVLAQLEILRRFGDSGEHAVPQRGRPPRSAPNGIAAAQPPQPDPDYERRLPVHPDLLTMGMVDPVPTFPDELIEQLAAGFMFEGFPGIQAAFFDVASVLDEHGIEVFGPHGQYVIGTLVKYLGEEMFGDFERWIPCMECGEEFMVEVTLETVNASLLKGGWLCERCRAEKSSGG